MKTIFAILALLALCFMNANAQAPLKVEIYYESLCSDSMKFISQQLYPAYPALSPYMNLIFYPYGKATHQFVDGQWIFQCQHGPQECHGNIIHTCALYSARNNSAAQVEFVNCMMSLPIPLPASDIEAERCATEVGLSWPEISACIAAPEGSEMLAAMGDITHAVVPPITFVPTIIYNEVYDSELQNASLVGFLQTVCSLIDVPEVCPVKNG